eukprot:9494360-Pyramimonas_sp.AAC.1
MAGKPLFPDPEGPSRICRMVLCEVAGDLDEMAKTLCMPDYRAKFGCIKCFHEKQQLDDFSIFARTRTHTWMLTAASTSLSWHDMLSDDDVEDLRSITHQRHKRGGVVVKARKVDKWPNLKIGDRIEPAVPGVSRGVPGLELKHFIYDSMHVVELGILGYLHGRVLRMLLDIRFFGYFTDGEHAEVNGAMSEALKQSYSTSRTPDDMRIHSLTVLMLGEDDMPFLKLKAAKSRRFLPFVIDILENQGGANALDNSCPMGCEGTKLLEVASSLAMYFDILKREPRNMSEVSLHNLQHTIDQGIDAWGALGLPFQMKWHAWGKHF